MLMAPKCVAISSLFLLLLSPGVWVEAIHTDPNGYILYCPCMGRFGNQAEHFLGALAFAHNLDRTLVLPPWVEYETSNPRSVQIPFDTYFKVEPLRKYHRVILMEDFMKDLAPAIWPVGSRTVFCYSARSGSADSCNAKDGNPFGSFWDTFNIDFDSDEFYGPLYYDSSNAHGWKQKYPASSHYVMAFTGAPASFPVREEHVSLHQYLLWSDNILNKAKTFIQQEFGDQPFLGLHFRNGQDWKNACDHVEGHHQNLFASAQCLGFTLEHGSLSKELCYPSSKVVLKQIKKAVVRTKVKVIFVATDRDDMKKEITKATHKKVKVVTYKPQSPHVDLAILGLADYHIGNCVSTFSAFAVRERRVNNLPVAFWAFPGSARDEL